MIGWIVGGLITAVAIGMIYYTVNGQIKRPNLQNIMQNENIQNAVIEQVNRTTNEVTLKDFQSGKRVQVTSSEGIAPDIKEGERMTV